MQELFIWQQLHFLSQVLFFTDGENQDGLVYFLDITGSDSAVLRLLNLSAEDFLRQSGNTSSIFLFNTREKNTYPFGGELKYLP